MTQHPQSHPTLDSVLAHARILGALVFAAMLTLAPGAFAASDNGAPGSAAAGSEASAPASSNDTRLQIYLQRRFRLDNAADVQVGPRKPSGIHGLFSRIVKVHNEQGQSAAFVVYTDAAEKTAIISDVEAGSAKPGPIHGLWSRPLRAANAPPNSPVKSELITDSPGAVVLGTVLDLTKDPWGRIDLKKLHLGDRATLGAADAPVTIVEFGDFECPYCARAFGDIETLVNTTYKGKVRLIFKNFPLNIHPWATQAAIAAECVRRQNPQAFWPFADDIYRDQGDITPQNLRQHVVSYAGKLGLDNQVLEACMMGSEAAKQVEQDRNEGNAVGINSTPTFFVNGIELVGLPTGKTFDYVINSELKKHAEARR